MLRYVGVVARASTWCYTQQDPIGLAGGFNLYGFAFGDPINFSDPYGLDPCKATTSFGNMIIDEVAAGEASDALSYASRQGLSGRVVDSFRTAEQQQDRINRFGEVPNGRAAGVGKSCHEAGTCLDIDVDGGPRARAQLTAIMRRHGFHRTAMGVRPPHGPETWHYEYEATAGNSAQRRAMIARAQAVAPTVAAAQSSPQCNLNPQPEGKPTEGGSEPKT
jgi:hypothetical protein